MSELFRKLRENNSSSSPQSPYTFKGGDSHPFRQRPGGTMVQPSGKKPAAPTAARQEDGDREHAYSPPVKRDDGVVYEWEPPGVREILKDLGLRILEVTIASAALAMGEEIAYFFRKRRFYTDEQKRRQSRR